MKKRKALMGILIAAAVLLTACGADEAAYQSEETTAAQASTQAQTASDTTQETQAASDTEEDEDEDGSDSIYLSADKTDLTDSYDAFDAVITLKDGATAVTGDGADGVTVDGDTVTIEEGGIYEVTGSLSDGQLVITAEKKVRLYLDGVSISCADAPALVSLCGKRTVLSLAPDSENMFSDSEADATYRLGEQEIDPCAVYVQDSLTINGSGSLTVSGQSSDGMVVKDYLKLIGGTIAVDAVQDGVKGKDAVALMGADVTVTAGNDGVKATTAESETKGFLQLDDGALTVSSGGDCLQAVLLVRITDGTYDLTSTGAAGSDASAKGIHTDGSVTLLGGEVTIDAPEDGIHAGGIYRQTGGDITVTSVCDSIQSEGDFTLSGGNLTLTTTGTVASSSSSGGFGQNFGGRGGAPMAYTDDTAAAYTLAETASTESTGSSSSKGIKCGGVLTLSGGTCAITSTDHAVHSAGDGRIDGTDLTISSGQKGISVHGNLTIASGAVTIETATEGIESKTNLTISGGEIRILYASDDGINTGGTGGQDASGGEHNLTISGGYVFVCADCDGIDSNSTLTVSGGTVVVYGPTTGGDGSLDFGSSMSYTGGILLALSQNGMMEYAEEGLLVTTAASASAGDTITVLGADGNLLISVITPKSVSDVIVGAPDAENCTIYVGGTVTGSYNDDNVALDGSLSGGSEVSIAVSGGMGGGFGGGGQGFGGGGQQGFGGRGGRGF